MTTEQKKNKVTVCASRPQGFRNGWTIDYYVTATRRVVEVYSTKAAAMDAAKTVNAHYDHVSLSPLPESFSSLSDAIGTDAPIRDLREVAK